MRRVRQGRLSPPGVSCSDRLSVSATDGSGNTSSFAQLPALLLTSTAVPDQSVPPDTNRHVLTQFSLENITQGAAAIPSLTELIVPFRGAYTDADVGQFELYENTSDDFNSANVVSSAFSTAIGIGEDISFLAPTPIAVNPGDTRCFWITADINPLAVELVAQPAPLTVANIVATSAMRNVSWTTDCLCSGYLATVRPFGTPEAPPQDGVAYAVGSFIAPKARLVYRGNLNTFFYQ